MSQKQITKIAFASQIIGAGLFASSFFVVDNAKAVRRRWIAIGFIVGGSIIHNIPQIKQAFAK